MERDLHYYREQSMHKDEAINRLLSEIQTRIHQEKNNREDYLTNSLPSTVILWAVSYLPNIFIYSEANVFGGRLDWRLFPRN